jgi:predicted Zn finger-like uncharacterized protein
MRWQCPNCKAVLKITEPSRFSGPGPITVKCPKCGQTLQIELPNVSEGGSLMPSVPMTAITSAPLETTETAVSTDLPGHSLTAQPPLLTTLIRDLALGAVFFNDTQYLDVFCSLDRDQLLGTSPDFGNGVSSVLWWI